MKSWSWFPGLEKRTDMLKKAFIIVLINSLFLNYSFIFAQDFLSLEPLIKEAQKNNPQILSAKKRYEAAKARIPQSKSLEDPVIGLTFEKIPRGTIKIDKTMSDDRMLSITQALPFFGTLSLKGKIALVESQMFAAEIKDNELEIIKQVKNAYYDLFMNYKEIELTQENLEFLKGVAKIAEARYSLGEIQQEEILKVTLEIANLATRIQNLKEEQAAMITRMNTLLNRDPETVLGEPKLAEEMLPGIDMKLLYKLTLVNNPELLVFSYAIEKNKYAKSLAKRSIFSEIMSGIVQRGITAGTIGPWDLMLSFTLPLWFWTKQRYQIKEAIANAEEAEAVYQAMKNKALAETKDLATKVETAKNRISLYKNNLMPILEASIKSSLAGLRSGDTDFMLLLDNERMLLETRMNYYQALVEYNKNLADLEQQVGLNLSEVKNEK
jgi:cobalt-zinc-cadmium efflux system outer membrane protein